MSTLCSRSSYAIASYCTHPRPSSPAPSIVLLDLVNPVGYLSPPAAPPPPSLSLPVPTGVIGPPPPRASLGRGRESCPVLQAVNTCADVATCCGGRFPFIALMSRHIEPSYICHPRLSSTLLPCLDHTIVWTDPSFTFTLPLPSSDLTAESSAELLTSCFSDLRPIHLPATQP
jgi:hypothetical protein